jgi:acyl-CoA dehydrogenase
MVTIALAGAAICLLAYWRASLAAWTGSLAVLLSLWIFRNGGFTGDWKILWIIFAAAALVINVPGMRRTVLMKPLFLLFSRLFPSISRTEREALEAGTVWWDAELFTGDPDWNKLLGTPKPRLTDGEQAFLDGPVERLCGMLEDWKIVAGTNDLPPEVWQFIKAGGFFGMIIPKEYGGLGFSANAHSAAILKIASRSVAAAVTVMVPNSLGPAELLLRYGTEGQKKYYLPRLAKGEEIPCLALTGPEAGSDAAAIPDTGTVCRGIFRGEEIIGIKLNWEKRYTTLAPLATLLGLAFRLSDPEKLLGSDEEPGITLALIPTDTPGISIGRRHDPLGIPFQNGPNWGKDVFIPVDWVIGGRAGIGQGWRMLMACLAAGRSVSLPALSCGCGKLVARAVGAYSRVRRQFSQAIGRFEGIEEVLARIAGNTYLVDAAREMTCGAVDSDQQPAVISAIVKYQSTERMRSIANDGMDVLGGHGICLGPRNLLGRIYQAAPIGITVEGANILTRSMIIFGQGVVRCHPYVFKEMQAVTDSGIQSPIKTFDQLIRSHVAFFICNAARSFFLGITGGRLARAPSSPVRRYFQIATRFSAALALAADASLLAFGGSLKRRERVSSRLADILSHLYLVSALLKRFNDRQNPADEFPLLEWGTDECFNKIQESFVDFFRNLPLRPLAWLLWLLIFPLGRSFSGRSGLLDSRLAGILMEPSPVRDRLTAGLYIPSAKSEPLARLEDALSKVIAAEPVERKLRRAVKEGLVKSQAEDALLEAACQAGIITSAEADCLRVSTAARREVIQVDDFAHL